MRTRFSQVFLLLTLLVGAFAGTALALDFDDEDPEPPIAEVGLVYYYEIGTHAGCLPHRLAVGSGGLPPGLTLSQLNDHTGLVSGIATEPGIFTAWLHLTDCANKSAETLFRFEVWVRRWGITTQALPSATLGSPYSFALEGKGVPSNVSWEIAGGSLPAGLSLSKEGTISGTPTAIGSSSLTVKATAQGTDPSSEGTRIDSRAFSLTVAGSLSASLSRRVAEVGVPVRSALVGSGGQGPYTWSARGGLPAGLRIGSDGVLSGVPKRAGRYTLTVRVADANGNTKDLQTRLIVRPRLTIATKALPTASVGQAYRVQLAVLGGAGGLHWAVASGTLPRGLTLARTGRISGRAVSAGVSRLTLRVRDVLGAVSTKTLVLTVK